MKYPLLINRPLGIRTAALSNCSCIQDPIKLNCPVEDDLHCNYGSFLVDGIIYHDQCTSTNYGPDYYAFHLFCHCVHGWCISGTNCCDVAFLAQLFLYMTPILWHVSMTNSHALVVLFHLVTCIVALRDCLKAICQCTSNWELTLSISFF